MEVSVEGKPAVSGRDRSSGYLGYVDGILRHREDYFDDVFNNVNVSRQILLLLTTIICLSAFHGLIMGTSSGIPQMLSSAVKVPVLFLLTLVVCFPVLYVVNVIMGSRLSFLQTLALILLAMALNSILLASCTPVVLFFTITGAKYEFLQLLHVAVFGFSGAWGMLGLWRGLLAMCEKSSLYPKQAVRILQVWILVFGFVGTQMAWSLRPFIGQPSLEFEIFRENQEGNFYEAVGRSASKLLMGNSSPDKGKSPKEQPGQRGGAEARPNRANGTAQTGGA